MSKAYTLKNILEKSVERYSSKIALKDNLHSGITYEQLLQNSKKIGFWMAQNGIMKTEKAAILSENSINWVNAFWGIVCMGAVVVSILPDFSIREINHVLKHSDAKLLFISKKYYIKHKDKLEFGGLIIIMEPSIMRHNNTNILDVPEKKEYTDFETEEILSEDVANIIYTSGTTGNPKGVMLTNENLCYEIQKVLIVQDVVSSDIFLSLLPLSHVYENVLGMILPISQGASIFYNNKPPIPSVLLETMQQVRPTMILTVPLIMEKIYFSKIIPVINKKKFIKYAYNIWPVRYILNKKAGKKLKKAFGGRLRFLGVGGAALNPKVERFLRDAAFPYSCGYGLTETSSLIFASKVGKVKFQSVGKPLNGLEYRVVRSDYKQDVGEIVVKWNGTMKGYYKDPVLTSNVLTSGSWFHTGDLAQMENGNLYLRGRSKTMILGPSGENIYPEEIESIINKMEGVIESLVYEVKGKILAKVYLNIDELSKKYGFLKESAKYHSADVHNQISQYLKEMRNNLNSHLNKYSQISKLELVHQPFEKTPTHKIKRHIHK
ncbi:MAG: AMP-binding protein [Bacteroidales bacterium]|nr:AMP-binding protein [Bacteroidales bacterium]